MFTSPSLAVRLSRLFLSISVLFTLVAVTPIAGGAAGTTYDVANVAQWDAAVRAVRPGDTIRLTATINAPLQYRGNNDGRGTQTGVPGTGEAPITITAAPGVWIDPGNRSNQIGALDIVYVDHVHAVGVRVRNSQFGIRSIQTRGTASAPIRIMNNVVEDIGHAGIHFGGHLGNHSPSNYGLISGNTVRRTGLNAAHFGEGIYLGHGGTEWVDETSHVVVSNNHISFTGAEAVDIKPGTRDITVENNRIHDISPISGGAISVHYVGAADNPKPAELDYVLIQNNDLWNINLDGKAGANDWPIWVGHGGVDIVNNRIWGLRSDPNRARAIRIRALRNFGPHSIRITDNTFWTATGWMAEGSPSGASNVIASGNIGFASGGGTQQVPASHFVGPVPAIGQGGTADSGNGPGSAFRIAGSAPAPTTTAAPRATTTTAAPATVASPETTAARRATTTTTVAAPETTAAPRATTTTTAPATVAAPETTAVQRPTSTTAAPSASGPSDTPDPDSTLDPLAAAVPAASQERSDSTASSGGTTIEGVTPRSRAPEDEPDSAPEPVTATDDGADQRTTGETASLGVAELPAAAEPIEDVEQAPPARLSFDDEVAVIEITDAGADRGLGLRSLLLLLMGGGVVAFLGAHALAAARQASDRRLS